MLSVLLPIHDTPCATLIGDLCRQGAALDTPVEVIAMEDGSTLYIKENLHACREGGDRVRHVVLERNVGRSAIRNRLAEAAAGEWLIFMDCDSELPDGDYLARYAAAAEKLVATGARRSIVCGGRTYKAKNDYPHACALHHAIGSLREPVGSEGHGVRTFFSNNFMISRDLMLAIRFDETMRGYGHEDTRFGIEAARRGVAICHIDNPVIHLRLDDDRHFLAKSREAVANLLYLQHTFFTPDEARRLPLLRAVEACRRCGLLHVIKWCAPWLTRIVEANLTSGHPAPRLFDLYKLIVAAQTLLK